MSEKIDCSPIKNGKYNWGDCLKTSVEFEKDGEVVIIKQDGKSIYVNSSFFMDICRVWERALEQAKNSKEDKYYTMVWNSLATSRSLPICELEW